MPQAGSVQQKLMTELEDAIRNRPAPYGSHYQKLVEKKRSKKKTPEKANLAFSLFPLSESELFSPDELYDLSTDKSYARTVLESYTGNKPSKREISELQSRVQDEYPDLESEIEPRKPESAVEVSKKFANDLYNFIDNGEIQPLVDFIINYPEVVNGRGFQEAAQAIQEAGYEKNRETRSHFNTIKAIARHYQNLPGGREGLLRKSEKGFEGEANRELNERLSVHKAERQQETPLRMREARKIEEEVGKLKKTSARIAPLNETHDEAKELLRQGINRDSLDLAKRELEASKLLKIPSAVDPYLESANESPVAFINQFKTDYGPVFEGYRQEARKDFLEHDLPQINSQFASKGAFFSGAREAALNKARTDKEERIEREIAKLTSHSHDEAMKHYHEHRNNKLKSAEIAGNAKKAQQESHLRSAEQHRLNTLAGTEKTMKDVAALGQIASAEQTQAQNAMNLKMAEYREEQERPFLEIAKKSAIAADHPIPPALFYPQVSHPVPPNPFGFGSALLGQVAGLQKMGQQGAYAKGGLVRRGYASGDSVSRAANELKQMQGHSTPGPYEQEILHEGRALKNDRIDPMAQYLLGTAAHQMANIHEDPLKTLGEGWKQGLQGHNAATIHNQESRQKYINLLGKINESRLEQQKLLANYHTTMKNQEETQRVHNMSHAENRRYHDMMHQHTAEKPAKLSITDKKLVSEAQKDILRSLRMKKEINHLGKLITKTDTGPVPNFIKSFRPQTETDNKIEMAANKLILDMHQGMKNIPRSEEFLRRIETTKPNRRNYLETNKQSLDMMNQGADDVMENSISALLSAGWSPEKIEKQYKIKIPSHLLGGGGEEEEDFQENNRQSEHEGGIKMIGPDGIEYEIPHSQVQAAIQDGGRVIT